MKDNNLPLINPARGKNAPETGPALMLVSTQNDMEHVSRLSEIDRKGVKNLYTSRIYGPENVARPGFSVAGPYMGAPYAVMLLETLIAWGAKEVLVSGWCGSISPDVKTGDVVLASGALVDEGTSGHYDVERIASPGREKPVEPSGRLTRKLKEGFSGEDVPVHEGVIWTTDAIFRETPEKIDYFRNLGAIAVEMELSALFSVAAFRGIPIAAALTVSDDLSGGTWRPGFSSGKFKKARKRTAEIVLKKLMELEDEG